MGTVIFFAFAIMFWLAGWFIIKVVVTRPPPPDDKLPTARIANPRAGELSVTPKQLPRFVDGFVRAVGILVGIALILAPLLFGLLSS